ncbi:hypothetical protein EKK58_05945 [Candidatus Dependentiae bacterium]|nr:MAG: hypothetical protein EKK58_05945 [Candidatus Dependentiae bacterium]
MTAVVNTDCSLITIGSDNFATDNLSNTLTVTINGVAYEVDIPTTTLTTFELDAAAVSLDSLPKGVYALKLTCTLADSSTTEESLCRVLLCEEDCNVIDLYATASTSDTTLARVLAYEALKYVNDCSTCSCTVASLLYANYTQTDVTDCGCN